MPAIKEQLLSRTVYDTDGTTTIWDFAFTGGYLDPSHVKAYTETPNGLRTALAINPAVDLIGPFQLRLTPPLPAGLELVIYRDTPKDLPLVDFNDESGFSEIALDTNAKQAVFIAAETTDTVNALRVADAVEAVERAAASAASSAASASLASGAAGQANIDANTAASAASAASSSALTASNAATAAASSASLAAGAVAAFATDIASPTGSALVGFRQAGTGAVATNVQSKLREFVSVKDFIPVGTNTTTTDCSAFIQAAIDASNGSVLFGEAQTYLLNTPLTVYSPNALNLNGSTLNFSLSAFWKNTSAITVQANNVTIENGTVNVTGAELGTSSAASVPIYGGREDTGEGWDNLIFRNLTLSTNGVGALIFMGENRNVLVENIIIADSATIRLGIAFEWGGTSFGTGHPHNITIRNVKAGRLTFPGNPVTNFTCVLWLSSAFNVQASNIYADEVPTLVNVFTGDQSNLYAPAAYQNLVGTNIKIDNAACEDITGYGVRVYGLGTFSPTPLPQNVTFTNLRLKDKAAGLYTTIGILVEYCTGVTVRNFSCDGFIHGAVTGPDAVDFSLEDGEIKNCGLMGVQFGSTGTPAIRPVLRNVLLHNNNTFATTGVTTACAVLLSDVRDPIIEGCAFGRLGSAETQRFSISATGATVRPRLNNNHTYAIVSGGVSYLIDVSTNPSINACGINNTSESGITNAGGAPIFQISSNGDRVFTFDTSPVGGTYRQGDRVYFPDPVAAGWIGAVCVTAGTPGTWKNFGAIAA